jgi:5-methyltetrahydropteroyltriglutamate--homocysteine methyltransferase
MSNAMPFRAELIGSLLRPEPVKVAMARHRAGQLSAQTLREIQDRAIDQAIALQEDLGFRCVTDGEFRRQVYFSYFYVEGLGGIEYAEEGESAWTYRNREGHRMGSSLPVVRRRLAWQRPVNLDDYLYLRAHCRVTPKITLPGPNALHFFAGRHNIDRAAYPDLEVFFDDVVEALRREILVLAEAGCSCIQIDETALAKFADPDIREALRARGDDWEVLLGRYIGNLNRVVAGLPAGLQVGVHMCRGNRQGHWQAEGGYDAVAERLFSELAVERFFLEYDSPRAGDFSPLRFVPRGKRVVLGLVSTKTPVLESRADLLGRIEAAARVVDLDRLAVSPQCGFASDVAGNPLSEDEQRAKLALVADLAREVWGST